MTAMPDEGSPADPGKTRFVSSLPVRVALFVAAYLLAARLAVFSRVGAEAITSMWPASGLVLATLVLARRNTWGIWLTAVWLANLANAVWAGLPWPVAVGYSMADVAEGALAAGLLIRVVGRPVTLGRLREVVALVVVAATASNAVTALAGAAVTSLQWGVPLRSTWFAWWMSNGSGMLQVAPLVLAWRDGARRLRDRGMSGAAEIVVLLGTLALASVFVFSGGPASDAWRGPLPYVVFPWLMWAAFRTGPFFATLASIVASVPAVWYTAHGMGPFVAMAGPASLQVVTLQTFLGIAVISSLLPAAAVAERERTQRDLATAHRRFRAIFENANDTILLLDDGRFVDCNQRAESLFGLARDRLLGTTPAELSPVLQRDGHVSEAAAQQRIRKALAGGPQYFEWTHKRADASLVDVEVGLSAVEIDGRTMLVAMVRDVSDRRRLEEELRQAQKMEAVGRLAGGIAHDFNNLLQVIKGYADLAYDDLAAEVPTREAVGEIRKAAERASALTGRLLAFSRKQVMAAVVTNLNDIIADMEAMLRRLIGEDIELVTILAAGLGTVRVDPGQIEQVVLNLAVNARDAMPQGGKLTLRTADVHLGEGDPRAHADLPPGRYVSLSVSDTGIGMSDDVRARVFEPFFTTKGRGKGTGLGLSTVYGIVRQSGGHVAFTSREGAGTTFEIHLPVVEEAPAQVAPAACGPGGGSETILVVEDEAPVRALARRVLERMGYAVLEAANGPDAIAQASAHGAPIDLVLTDVVMPGMAGPVVAASLRALRPAIKVLYMSGYTDDAISERGLMEADAAVVPKPFSAADLGAKVRAALDTR